MEQPIKKKGPEFRVNVGSSSILLIFVILCLVAFATLSIISANADATLSQKVADRTLAYYNTSNQAQRSLAAIDKTLAHVYAISDSESSYFESVGYEKSYLLPITDLQSLSVTLMFLYPQDEFGPFYQITSWQVITTGQLEYENAMLLNN